MPVVLAPDGIVTPSGLLTGHVVRIADNKIIDLPVAGRHPVDVHLPRQLVLPGLVNAHSHAFQRAFRGHVQWRPTGHDDFWSWRDRMYATANALDPDGVQAVSALAFLEMARAGVTRVGEFHYLHHRSDGTPYADPDELAERVVAAAAQVGIHLTLLRVAYARSGPGQPLRPDQLRFGDRRPDDVLAAIQRLASRHPQVTVGLAAHSVRALDATWLRELSAFEGVVHAHVSEQPAENAACLEEHGRSPLAVLADLGLVGPSFTAVHLTWPLEGDVDRLQDVDGTVCVCPGTELDLGDGFLPVAARESLRLCIGSDSHATIEPLGEARALELHARGLAGRRNVLAPEGDRHGLALRLITAASTAGAHALGAPGAGIVPGAEADLVSLDLDRVAADGVPPLEAAAFVATPEWVHSVWVGGRRIVSAGHHREEQAIRAAARPYLS